VKSARRSEPEAAARLAPLQQRIQQAGDTIRAAFATCERSCQQERDLLRQLEDLAASERTMYELDHAKDQVMTVLKLALANLVLWTRDRYFPATYAQASLSSAGAVLPLAWPYRVGQRHRTGGTAFVQ
jgi:hypothetical protein